MPSVIVCEDADAASRKAASIFADAIISKPDIVLGMATGGTPVGMYRELAKMHRDDGLDFSRVSTFNLDEYIGLSPTHSQSYRAFMQETLFDHINIEPSNTHIPDGMTSDVASHAEQYESLIRDSGGIDLQLLGIGHNGHIAFNEPGSQPESRTRMVDLTDRTIRSNARFFDSIDDVPKTAITMGIGTILEAKRIVLLALGSDKAAAIERVLDGTPSAEHPASFLKNHPAVTIILDRDAALASRTA